MVLAEIAAFAVGLLLAGVPPEDIATLLGHSNGQTTERNCAPRNRSRCDRHPRVPQDTYRRDSVP